MRTLYPSSWRAVLGLIVAGLVLATVTFGFRAQYLGWFGESVPDVARWGTDWQTWLDQQPIEHPAMVHLMPEGCLCRFFTGQHAADLSIRADALGYQRYQAGDDFLSTELAQLLLTPSFPNSPGPMLALTGADGQIRYLGPYSDGLRCTTANSLVDDWLPLSRPGRVLQVDANSCQCESFGLVATGG
ncbi:DUF6436 domain-containing protein [Saccharospirillum sp.]|uniref:DUF6436 domain-containing protein n=1 Tax=Saccharospirillum sp. TaxID=2033801 RepID=UPI0034A0321C